MATQSSCLYVSVLTERQLAVNGTWPKIIEAVLAWRTDFARLLDDAVAAGGRVGWIDTEALAEHVFVTFEGAFFLSRSLDGPAHMRTQLRALRQLLEALLLDRAPA